MELGTEKSTILTNSTSDIGADIKMNGQKLEALTSLKYLGAVRLCKKMAPAQQKSAAGLPQQ